MTENKRRLNLGNALNAAAIEEQRLFFTRLLDEITDIRLREPVENVLQNSDWTARPYGVVEHFKKCGVSNNTISRIAQEVLFSH